MRPAARAAAALAALAGLAAPAAGQRIGVGVGAAVASRLLVDGNGTTVRLRPAPYLALDAARPLHGRSGTSLVGMARVAYADARASADGARWSAGDVVQADLAAGVRRPLSDRLRAHAALGGTLLAGPRDVRPFDGTVLSLLAEVGLDVRLDGSVRAGASVQGYRVAPEGGAAGGVLRVLVGVTHAR